MHLSIVLMILVWEGSIKSLKTVRDAINQGFDFNGVENGISLDLTRHCGSHPSYTKYVQELIQSMDKTMANSSALERVRKVVEMVSKEIQSSQGKINLIGK